MDIRLGEAFWGKDTGMQLIDQLLNFIRTGLSAVFRFIELVWRWAVQQILSVPWGALGDLPLWKQLLLVIVAAAVIYLLYRAIREMLDAGRSCRRRGHRVGRNGETERGT
jgi:hypothetical protein